MLLCMPAEAFLHPQVLGRLNENFLKDTVKNKRMKRASRDFPLMRSLYVEIQIIALVAKV